MNQLTAMFTTVDQYPVPEGMCGKQIGTDSHSYRSAHLRVVKNVDNNYFIVVIETFDLISFQIYTYFVILGSFPRFNSPLASSPFVKPAAGQC